MKKFIRSNEYFLVAMLVLINLGIGALTFSHYGESWDEQNYFFYANQSIQAYAGLFQAGFVPAFDPTIRYYGPIFTIPAVLLWKLFPSIVISDIQHILNWLTFQFGLVVFYLLARRWLKIWSSFGATLLLLTQPLLWGHSFINPKDTPYMVAFLSSIYFGLRMLDTVDTMAPMPLPEKRFDFGDLRVDWSVQSQSDKRWTIAATAGLIVLSVILSWMVHRFWPVLPDALQNDGSAAALSNYLRNVVSSLRLFVLILLFPLTSLWIFILPRFPHARRVIVAEFSPLTKRMKELVKQPAVVIASLVLGVSLSIRLLAFAAAGILLVLLFFRRRDELVPLTFVYGGIAAIIMFATWPYLWWEPVVRFLVTLRVMLNFPWPGQTLFDGVYYSPDMLPGRYLPVLWGMQFTESCLLLVLIGLGVFVWGSLRRRLSRELIFLIGLWGLLPFVAAMIARPSLYDNARQLFFILPPFFLLGGLGFEFIFDWIRGPRMRGLLIFLALLPGLIGIIRLHPYEYIYYNHLSGGVSGAERRFELDYWGTSYRNVASYLNANAPKGAKVIVFGPTFSLSRYTRSDIRVFPFEEEGQPVLGSDYAVMLTRNDSDLQYFIDAPSVYQVEKMGALLSVVKKVGQ